jgi:hypothetical protein
MEGGRVRKVFRGTEAEGSREVGYEEGKEGLGRRKYLE